jgi:cyclohexanone monooxygenase
MIMCIQQHVDWITDSMDYLSENGLATMEASQEAQDAWVQHVNDVAAETVFNDPSCNSWYLGANIEGKSRVFMPLIGYPPYVEKCDEVAANGYEGFVLS